MDVRETRGVVSHEVWDMKRNAMGAWTMWIWRMVAATIKVRHVEGDYGVVAMMVCGED